MKFVALGGIPVYGALLVFATPALRVWLGAQFNSLLPAATRIVCAGTFLSLIGVPAYYTLMGMGRSRDCFLSNGIQATTNAIVGISLVSVTAGMTPSAASWGTFCGMGVSTLYLVRRVQSEIRMSRP